jgi:hypothetical protein
MLNIEDGLRVASDRLLGTLEQLETLENEKRTLPPESERFQTLAFEIERLAAEIFAQSHAQEQLGEAARAQSARQGVSLPPIEESESVRELSLILADWRDAERRLQLADPDTAEHAIAKADSARLRAEYQSAYGTGLKAKQPNQD